MPNDTRSQSTSEFPSLEGLIAKYGDSSNTTWVEDKFEVWRHNATGAVQGYVISGKHCIVWGNPLCERAQYPEVAKAFLDWCRSNDVKPLWACVNEELESFLAKELGWRAVVCVQEDALDPTKSNPEDNKEVRKHIRAAERSGCKIVEEKGEPSDEVKRDIDEVIAKWKAGRRGTQVHTTNVEPWRDYEHRRYFYVRDADNKIVAFLFLARIGAGWAIKDSIQVNGAPKNVTEWLIAAAIHALADDDEHYLTFGPTPGESLQPVDNINGTVKWLSKSYSGIEHAFLGNKREFRRKFKVDGEPLFVCFPEDGLGRSGISAFMKVLTD